MLITFLLLFLLLVSLGNYFLLWRRARVYIGLIVRGGEGLGAHLDAFF
jgi:hypothetical protein